MTDDEILTCARCVLLAKRLGHGTVFKGSGNGRIGFDIKDAIEAQVGRRFKAVPGYEPLWDVFNVLYAWMYDRKPLTKETVHATRTETARRATPGR